MLVAIRKSDGQIVSAYHERKENGPFRCQECRDPVILRIGHNRINHFAHENPIQHHYSENESELHRRCKMEIFEALRKLPNARDAALERSLGAIRLHIQKLAHQHIVLQLGRLIEEGKDNDANSGLLIGYAQISLENAIDL